MTTKTHEQISRMVRNGTIEVISWFAIRHGRGMVEVRNITTGKRKTWQVENIPSDFSG
jgi:hypothetical protein